MTSATQAAPRAVNPEADRLHEPENPPAEYSETLVFMGYDPNSEVGIYHHFTRMHEDIRLWEGVLTVFRPGGQLLTHRSLGKFGTLDKADSGPLSFEVIKPLHTWRLRFSGSAICCTTRRAAEAVVESGPTVPLKVDLTFDGSLPTWSAGAAMEGQDWGDAELEQGGHVTGEVEIDGRSIRMDFNAFRAHTSGPRNCAGLDKEAWTWAFFPGGRTFLACEAWQDPGIRVVFGFVAENGKLYAAKPTEVPPLHDAEGAPRKGVIQLTTDLGDMRVEVEALEAMGLTLRAPIGLPLGVDWSKPRNTILVECPARFNWNGEVGYGWLERFNRVERLSRPAGAMK